MTDEVIQTNLAVLPCYLGQKVLVEILRTACSHGVELAVKIRIAFFFTVV
jgi:hypothetical protein